MINMSFAYYRVCVATFGLCAGAFASGCMDARDQARDELQTRLPRVREALPAWYAARDVDSLATLYDAESVLFLPETDPIEGVDAITAHWREAFTDVHWSVQMRTQDLQISPPLAMERGTFRWRAVTPGSNEVMLTDSGQFVRAWHYGLRGWKIRYDVVIRASRNKE